MSTREPALGLRERKNLRTRRSIVHAAAELTIEGGYAFATINRIAERADVAPRTVSTWFPTKDDILFERIDEQMARALRHLQTEGGDVIDRLQAWFAEEGEREQPDREISRLRLRAIAHDPELRARDRQHLDHIEDAIAASVARDHGMPVQSMGPQMIAAAAIAMMHQLRSSLTEAPDALLDEQLAAGFAVLRAGLDAIEP